MFRKNRREDAPPTPTLAIEHEDVRRDCVGFELKGGETEVRAFLNGSKLFTLAESLGGFDDK